MQSNINTAMDNALAAVGDAFRPERKEVEARVLAAAQAHEMIARGRYTAKELNVDEAWYEQTAKDINWIEADQRRINISYNLNTNTIYPWQRTTRDWCLAKLAALRNPNVVSFGEMLFAAMAESQKAVRS